MERSRTGSSFQRSTDEQLTGRGGDAAEGSVTLRATSPSAADIGQRVGWTVQDTVLPEHFQVLPNVSRPHSKRPSYL